MNTYLGWDIDVKPILSGFHDADMSLHLRNVISLYIKF